MSKRKTHDLDDIIETAYVVADYSHGNGYYDKATDNDIIKRNRSFGQTRGPLHEPSRFGSTGNDTFRNDGGNGGSGGSGGSNIFLKNSQNNMNNSTNTNADKNESSKIDLNDDNFPSLGSKLVQPLKNNKSTNVEHKLDFKKIVEKKPEVVNKPDHKVSNTQYKKFSYNQYSLYQEVKEKSEMIAHLKMVDDISSDDNIDVDDNYY
jgi:hypothetical protein